MIPHCPYRHGGNDHDRWLVADWVAEHPVELAACWERASRGEPAGTIEPLA
jgi:hypothetical protein